MACGSLLELKLLNSQMGNQGIIVGADLRFYTRTLAYGVGFGPNGSFNMEKFNKFLGFWEDVMFSGTLEQTVNTLNNFGPFLSGSDITTYWADVVIPPEAPNVLPLFDPV